MLVSKSFKQVINSVTLSGAPALGAESKGNVFVFMFFTGDEYFVYIIANATRVLYIGMTNNLPKRFLIHRMKLCKGFTSHFHLCRLVYYETYGTATDAINREKQLKRWRREK